MLSWQEIVDILYWKDGWDNSLLRWIVVVAVALAAFVLLRLVRQLLPTIWIVWRKRKRAIGFAASSVPFARRRLGSC